MLSAALMVSGCASWSPIVDPTGNIDYLVRALRADASSREQMWRGTVPSGGSEEARLRRALMQSVPGHTGYEPAAAESALQRLADDGSGDIASVARLRVAEMKADQACRQEVTQLRQRLSRVVDIERKLHGN
jgi:hypothetical protein